LRSLGSDQATNSRVTRRSPSLWDAQVTGA
jgi:hypothetical protein